jgi:ABC-type tungstate transport system substrate-binding protein
VFVALSFLLLVMLAAGRPRQAALGVGVVLLGLPVYFLLKRRGALGRSPD